MFAEFLNDPCVVCRIKLRFSDSYRLLDTLSVPACSVEEVLLW